jgi:hypothetical protein
MFIGLQVVFQWMFIGLQVVFQWMFIGLQVVFQWISSISYGFKLNLIALKLMQEEVLVDLLWLYHLIMLRPAKTFILVIELQ